MVKILIVFIVLWYIVSLGIKVWKKATIPKRRLYIRNTFFGITTAIVTTIIISIILV